jgi:hypothetical protein
MVNNHFHTKINYLSAKYTHGTPTESPPNLARSGLSLNIVLLAAAGAVSRKSITSAAPLESRIIINPPLQENNV